VSSGDVQRHRLSRASDRQHNYALHVMAITQIRRNTASRWMTQARCHPPARDLLTRRKAGGDGGLEALRILKRRPSDVVYRALQTDT
jgi:hypothetical protein